MRRLSVVLGLATAFACAEGFAPGGSLRLRIVPVFAHPVFELLTGDLNVIRIEVTSLPAPPGGLVADTAVAVDTSGNATATLAVPVDAANEEFAIVVQGVRSSDGTTLYSGTDTITVPNTGGATTATVPVNYVGPCQPGSACTLTLAPDDTVVGPGAAFAIRIAVDSGGTPRAGVPVALTNLSPSLVTLKPPAQLSVSSTATGGVASVLASIRSGAVDTLQVFVSVGQVVSPGYATLRTTAPGNTVQLIAGFGNVTWTSRNSAVATVSGGGVVTAAGPGSTTVVAASPGVTDSVIVAVGNPTPPGQPIALAVIGGRSFPAVPLGQPLSIDALVDLKAVPTDSLGSYNARFSWDPTVLRFDSTGAGGTFDAPTLNADSASGGVLRFASVDANGRGGVQTLVRMWFTAIAPGSASDTLQITEMSAAKTFTDFVRPTDLVVVASGDPTVLP